jgi:hypothetical protein
MEEECQRRVVWPHTPHAVRRGRPYDASSPDRGCGPGTGCAARSESRATGASPPRRPHRHPPPTTRRPRLSCPCRHGLPRPGLCPSTPTTSPVSSAPPPLLSGNDKIDGPCEQDNKTCLNLLQ